MMRLTSSQKQLDTEKPPSSSEIREAWKFYEKECNITCLNLKCCILKTRCKITIIILFNGRFIIFSFFV